MVHRGEIICVYSDLSELELDNAPEKVKEHFLNLPDDYTEYIEITAQIENLAREYIAEKVVGETSLDDCRHIAAATVNKTDYLISWNFKHIVNIERIRGYNSINIKKGYKQLEIRSPREFEKYEDD